MTDEKTGPGPGSTAGRLLAMDDGELREFALTDDGPNKIRSAMASALNQRPDRPKPKAN